MTAGSAGGQSGMPRFSSSKKPRGAAGGERDGREGGLGGGTDGAGAELQLGLDAEDVVAGLDAADHRFAVVVAFAPALAVVDAGVARQLHADRLALAGVVVDEGHV